jgi:hypothetical protein
MDGSASHLPSLRIAEDGSQSPHCDDNVTQMCQRCDGKIKREKEHLLFKMRITMAHQLKRETALPASFT